MKKWRTGMSVMAAVLAVLMGSGCALFVAGAGAAAGAGTVAYCGNELRVSRPVALDRAWEAANTAMKAMEFTVIPAQTRKDATGGTVKGRTASDQKVIIQVLRESEQITTIRVRVGIFGSTGNRNAARLLYETMSKSL